MPAPLPIPSAPPCSHNVEGCRILVTVPACLEILLMSPTSQAWVRRIRYAILDEVRPGLEPACSRLCPMGCGKPKPGWLPAC